MQTIPTFGEVSFIVGVVAVAASLIALFCLTIFCLIRWNRKRQFIKVLREIEMEATMKPSDIDYDNDWYDNTVAEETTEWPINDEDCDEEQVTHKVVVTSML